MVADRVPRPADELRRALGGLAIHDDFPRYDAGTVRYEGQDLESGQEELSQWVAAVVRAGHLPVILGGGHETSFASHRGLVRGLKMKILLHWNRSEFLI